MASEPLERGIPAAVLSSAVDGDAHALARIVAAYHDDLVRLCYVVGGDAQLAEDAVQSAWAIALRKLGTLREPDRLRPWLMAIAANEARQLLRKRRRLRVAEVEVVDVGPGADPGARAAALDLRRALDRLPVEDRALLAMRHLGGYDSAEIGAALGISAEAARARLSRLVARLRVELSDD
jgi:RNA polymerase sigma factor (sigma-70 family)